jgi:hypothetical protein
MKRSTLKNIIREEILNEADNWTGKDLIDIHRAIQLAKKSVGGAVRNLDRVQQLISSYENKPQGRTVAAMGTKRQDVTNLGLPIKNIIKLETGLAAMFGEAWNMLNK